MSSIVQFNDWLEEEVDNMAREGLRTLVVAKKTLTHDQYNEWEQRYNAAKLSVVNRSAQVAAVIESLERDMELLCVTGKISISREKKYVSWKKKSRPFSFTR